MPEEVEGVGVAAAGVGEAERGGEGVLLLRRREGEGGGVREGEALREGAPRVDEGVSEVVGEVEGEAPRKSEGESTEVAVPLMETVSVGVEGWEGEGFAEGVIFRDAGGVEVGRRGEGESATMGEGVVAWEG